MNSIPVIGFSGWSGAGKTTLIEKVVRALKERGLRAAVVKHDGHDFDMDREGKDSWRYTQAGAHLSLISSPGKTAAVEEGSIPFREIIRRIRDVDIILAEGWSEEEGFPLIGVSRKAHGKGLRHPIGRYAALVTDEEIQADIPVFSLDDTEGVVSFIMETAKDFTHFNDQGRARMVDVGDKPVSHRTAAAGARVYVNETTFALIRSGGMKKGDVLTVAQIAGVMGAKRTPDLIPMCHPIALDGIDLTLTLNEEKGSVDITASLSCDGKTGVEMEALTAAATAALTVYDMCKAVQKDMVISDLRLLSKSGGVHGDFIREEEPV